MIALSASASASTALPVDQQPPDFRHRLGAGRIDAIALLAGPHRVFVQLQMLFADAAEHHRAESAVADRQRLVPVRGRLRVPQPQIVRRRSLFDCRALCVRKRTAAAATAPRRRRCMAALYAGRRRSARGATVPGMSGAGPPKPHGGKLSLGTRARRALASAASRDGIGQLLTGGTAPLDVVSSLRITRTRLAARTRLANFRLRGELAVLHGVRRRTRPALARRWRAGQRR